jgi:copper chaperone CopZ
MPEMRLRVTGMTNKNQDSEVHTTVLSVGGMSCGACVRHVARALEGLTGVVHVDVRLPEQEAIVEHLPAFVDTLGLIQAVRDAGYVAQINRTMSDAERSHDDAVLVPPAACRCGCGVRRTDVAGLLNLGTSTIG